MTGQPRDCRGRFLPKWPAEVRAHVRAGVESGRSIAEVARETGVSPRAIGHWRQREGWVRPGEPGLAPAAGSGREAACDPLARLRRLACAILDLADRRVALLRRELRASKGEAGERWEKAFAACVAGACRAADCLAKADRLERERDAREARAAERDDNGEAAPRSMAEVHQEFSRRLQAIYGVGDDAAHSG